MDKEGNNIVRLDVDEANEINKREEIITESNSTLRPGITSSSPSGPSSPLDALSKLGRYIMGNAQGEEGNHDDDDAGGVNRDDAGDKDNGNNEEKEKKKKNDDDDDDASDASNMLAGSAIYKGRYLEKQHSLFVMVLNEDGTHSYKDMRRDEILRECRQDIYTLSGGRISNPRVMFRGATQPRDIRVLDPGFSITENAILVRRHAILLKLSPLHCVIMRNKIILVVPEGADKILHDLQCNLKAITTCEYSHDQDHVHQNDVTYSDTDKIENAPSIKKKPTVTWDEGGGDNVDNNSNNNRNNNNNNNVNDLEQEPSIIPLLKVTPPVPQQPIAGNKRKEFETKKSLSLRSFLASHSSRHNNFSHHHHHHHHHVHNQDDEDSLYPPSITPDTRSETPAAQDDDYDPSSTSVSARAVIPFELKALESIFLILSDIVEKEFIELHDKTLKTTKNLIKKSSGAFLERLRQRKNDVAKMLSRIKAIRDAIETVLEDDADLALMRLTKVFQNPSRYSHANAEEWSADHEDVELLLENYMQIFEDLIARTDLIQQDILATENIINLRLDTARNGLLQVNLMVSSVTSAAAVAALIAGIFGMNLASGVTEEPYWFWSVAGTLVGGCILTVIIMFTALYKKGYLIT